MNRSPLPIASRLRVLAVTLALAASGLVQVPAPAHAQPAQKSINAAARAKELFKKGKREYDAGNMRGAYEAYIAAWDIQKSFDIAGNLAVVEIATVRYVDAIEHLRFALANLPVSGSAEKQRSVLQGQVREARAQVGAITIQVSVEGAAVTIDGRAVGVSPLKGEVYVDPGDHTVVAAASGFEPAKESVRAGKGSTHLVMLTLKKPGAPRGVPGGTKRDPPKRDPPKRKIDPILTAGYATAGLVAGAGTAFAILSKVSADGASSAYDKLGGGKAPNACAAPSPPSTCSDLYDARKRRDGFANASVWMFVGAGAVTAGTLVYAFVLPRRAGAPPVTAVPVVTAGGGALVVEGSF